MDLRKWILRVFLEANKEHAVVIDDAEIGVEGPAGWHLCSMSPAGHLVLSTQTQLHNSQHSTSQDSFFSPNPW